MAWPKTVPILTAKDICRCSYSGPGNSHCLIGWQRKAFGHEYESKTARVVRLALCEEIGKPVVNSDAAFRPITLFNDNDKIPATKIAKLWNRVMAKLGYVVGNPQAKQS
jgi:hypothetical protein